MSPLLRIVALLLGLALCVYVLVGHASSLELVVERLSSVSLPKLILASLFFLLHILLVFYAWHYSLGIVGIHVPPAFSGTIYIASLITRYLPGGVWHLGSRLVALSRSGADPIRVGATLYLEQAAALVVCVLLAVMMLLVGGRSDGGYIGVLANSAMSAPILGVVIALLTIGLYPAVFRVLLNKLLQTLKRPLLSKKIDSQALLLLYGIHAVSLLLFVGGYYYTASALIEEMPAGILLFSSEVLTATVIGFVAPFIPGGLGVREASLAVLLSNAFDGSDLALIVVLPRVLIVCMELMLFVGAFLLYGRRMDA